MCAEVLAAREAGTGAEGAGGAVSHRPPQRPARARAHPAQHPVREVRRPEVPRGRARQGPARAAALRREPARPAGGLPGPAAPAGHRAGRGRGASWPRSRPTGPRRPASRDVPPRGRRHWAAFAALFALLRSGRRRLAGRDRRRPPLVRAAPRAAARGRRAAPRRHRPALPDGAGVRVARELPDRPHPRSAAGDERPRRRAAARRGLSDPLHHPLRQGPGMALGLRAELRRRLHPVRPRHRQRGGDRGGAAAALRRDDPGARTRCTWSRRCASTSTARRRAATSTSTRAQPLPASASPAALRAARLDPAAGRSAARRASPRRHAT